MKTKKHDAIILSSGDEKAAFSRFLAELKSTPVPDDELLHNLGLFLCSKTLARLLFFYEMYRKTVGNHGVLMEFGVRWGQTLSILSALRGIFEPFNRHRKIIGFDTFAGLKGVGPEDGSRNRCVDGSFSVPRGYETRLETILEAQEQLNPMHHIRRFELVKGDVARTLPEYLARHPETMVSMAVFDLDLYGPTKAALEALGPHLCKGSILVFDELCDDIFPGETLALRETLGLKNVRVQRFPMTARLSYVEVE